MPQTSTHGVSSSGIHVWKDSCQNTNSHSYEQNPFHTIIIHYNYINVLKPSNAALIITCTIFYCTCTQCYKTEKLFYKNLYYA
jgi:hypothetical protein